MDTNDIPNAENVSELPPDKLHDPSVLGQVWAKHRDRLRRLVRLRIDRRLQGRVDPSDVLQEAFVDFAQQAAEYARQPNMPLFLWLWLLTGQRLQRIHRLQLGTQKRDADRQLSLHRGHAEQGIPLAQG